MILGGNKEKLAKRIAKWESRNTGDEKHQVTLTAFLNPKMTTAGNEKPKISQHYAATFSNVDKFNALISSISYQPRITNEKLRFFILLIEISVVQSCDALFD